MHLYVELWLGLCRALAAPWLEPWLMLDPEYRREVVSHGHELTPENKTTPQAKAEAAWGVSPRVIAGGQR